MRFVPYVAVLTLAVLCGCGGGSSSGIQNVTIPTTPIVTTKSLAGHYNGESYFGASLGPQTISDVNIASDNSFTINVQFNPNQAQFGFTGLNQNYAGKIESSGNATGTSTSAKGTTTTFTGTMTLDKNGLLVGNLTGSDGGTLNFKISKVP